MKLKLSLQRQVDNHVDIVVTADSTATVADVAATIAAADPLAHHHARTPGAGVTLSVAPPVGGELAPLPADQLIGDAPIGSGFIARVVPDTAHARPRRGGAAAAVLRVHSGPDAGREFALAPGHSVLGRSEGADVLLGDPLVSKRHARIEVGQSVELVDLNSANGLVLDGGRLPRIRVQPHHRILIGDTEISIEPTASATASAPAVLERGGALLFNRSPRVELRYPGTEHAHPAIPSEADPRLFPWPMLVAPILLGLSLFALTNQPRALFIIAMTPLMMLGNFVGQRTQQGKKLQREIEIFEEQFDELEMRLAEEVEVERERRHAEAPAVADVYDESVRLGPLLWTRRPEHWNFLSLRLGVSTAPSRNTIGGRQDPKGIPSFVRRVDELRERHETIDDVPLIELLTNSGAIGIAGPQHLAADVVRGLAVQLFGLHAPNEIVTAAMVGRPWASELDWMKWLPHTSSPRSPFADHALADSPSAASALLNGLEEAILERLSGTPTRRGPLRTEETANALGSRVGESSSAASSIDGDLALVLFVSSDAPVDRPRLAQLIERGPDAGIYTIFLAPTVESLPATCRTFIDATDGLDSARVGYVRDGAAYEGVRVEGVSREYAEVFAKRIAPVIDASSHVPDASDLPRSVALLSLLGPDTAEQPEAVIERWRQNNSVLDRTRGPRPRLKRASTLTAFIGQSSPDAMTLDLRTQGPHALVGGTTGSGKSEFLQAWVLGMAAEYSPDRVTFLFVDYKGGSAFADCVDLPHCVGLVTDLSPHLVRRALTSLRAELHHREHLFNRKKAKDLIELEKRQDPDAPPALVLVIDEFAALASDVPEFVDGVVDIAQRGRSLGIHLIMATQRPAGVIKDNLRANTNLRIALRMADGSDSNDVVGDPVAGSFDPSIPGRGIAKTGPGRLVPFQSGYAGGWTSDEPERATVRVAELRFGATIVWEVDGDAESDTHEEDLGPNDQKRLVASIIGAAERAAIPAPRRPWLPDLPTTVDVLALPMSGDASIPLGIADLPDRQLQEPVFFSPDTDGHLLVYGTSGAGKSTLLRSMALAVGARPDRGAAHVYAIDFGTGSLRSLETLPHVGAVVSGEDAERVQRLLRMIRSMLDDRARRFSAVNASTLSEYRAITGEPEPRILLIIDGFGTFKQEWDAGAARSPLYAIFMRVLGEGRPLGVHAIATADRYGSVPTAVSANVSRRIVLRMADENSYGMLGAAKDVLSERSAPGRAVVDGFETQLASIGGTTNVAEQTAALDRAAERLVATGAATAPGIGALPTRLLPSELPASIDGQPVIGIADDSLAPRTFEPIGSFVVAGPPRSGKTTALRWLVRSVAALDPDAEFFHIGGRRAGLRDERPWRRAASSVEDVRALAKELAPIVADESLSRRIVIVAESIAEYSDTDAERPLRELLQAINRSEHVLFGDGDVNQLSSGFGLVGELKAGRRGIVLKPDTYDGEAIFKLAFPRVQRHEFPEGRGMLVENGRAVIVQLPIVGEEA
ncbi:FtsK/SpoIIIE domain-containing protein [Yonghaparkia sp. Root332]|uniref:FtsK/SpoIIIE domain-containing protein n=1 Tax=Yonghaparkia sp. Root332 TaxID=1736516 RepID=UPI0006F44245|nr:FtsK/SpoIIIE domain-containing protein [Yonghaparkia sp. Root332]KQV26090.1 phosphopeptide-binding protein [Yonghaparkia sp. Root332]